MTYVVEREVYAPPKIERSEMRKLEDWKQIQFLSSTGKTPEFTAFCRMYRARLSKEAKAKGLKIVSWSNGHFQCSAFFKNTQTGKLAYLSTSDVRHFPNEWANNILVRTAEHEKDYTGGTNRSATLETIGQMLSELTEA